MSPDTSNKHAKEAIALWNDTEFEAEAYAPQVRTGREERSDGQR